MAIIFTTDILENVNLMAFNNNVIRYYTDTDEKIVLNSQITLNGQTITIYPTPDGTFYFNFKEYVSALVSSFKDTINPEIDATDDTTLSYNWFNFYSDNVTIIINFTDETFESEVKGLTFLAGVEQLDGYKRQVSQQGARIILSPLSPQSQNHYYVKYWEGFPFDVSFFNTDAIVGNNLTLENLTNLLDYDFYQGGIFTRLFFCDGSTDETINDLLPIGLGRNEIQWEDKFLIVDKQDVCSGIYLKWVNNYGGYSYYNFGNIYRRNQSVRSQGEINTDFDNIGETLSQTSEIGKLSGERISVTTDILTDEEFSLLQPLLISPEVSLFVGEPFSRADITDWLGVKIISQNYTVRNFKGQPVQFTFDIELPDLYTQNK